MKLHSFSHTADLTLESLTMVQSNTAVTASLQPENLKKCPYELFLISESPPDPYRIEKTSLDKTILLDLHRAWQIINQEFQNEPLIKSAYEVLSKLGKRLPVSLGKLGFRLWKFSSDSHQEKFFLLLKDSDSQEIITLLVRAVLHLWQLELNKVPLHSCGIIYDGNLYLFLGPSGAGKSTVAELSEQKGKEVLDEDQLMIYKKDDHSFAANAWGYSLRSSNIPIKGFFKIIQDAKDLLLPMTQTHMTCILMEQSIALTGYNLPDDKLSQLFERVSELARSVPGYELHFRKAPDFWKLIDDEFSKINNSTTHKM